ncbi:glycosyltransferase, partial [Lysinibacillus sp. D4B1_S16]|uniref:glycosyltransferase n=1 Tax=Lysinibacillus sp. D4B1_S16 TaxID=2941231 RepID=UPI0020BDE0C1
VDDGSKWATLAILQDDQKNCTALKIIVHPTNLGASVAYKRCIAEATGENIAIIDSVDHYFPAIRNVLAQVDGEFDIYYYNMIIKNGYAFI